MPNEIRPSCQVYLDGKPIMAPWHVDCHYAARGALGLRRGEGVARELGETGMPDGDGIGFPEDGWDFHEDERYVRLDITKMFFGDASEPPALA